ncbi:hypothetical protein OESDEN_09601 [Oesophagostomum dentatum]|uniref:Uncharacterized protein n=1 Tax=Oesophagostomum dentatum TaxID=61180 RepID=A0A0B1T596_OESDE|nr:hypothetical protein OESDEN_09601 [Oesophagostomum dentatum]
MGKLEQKDVIEFPDSTVNVRLAFSEKDMKLLDETEKTETTDAEYIPFFTMGWLLGEKYKPFVMGCTPEQPDDRTPNDPEAVSPDRVVPTDPKFFR